MQWIQLIMTALSILITGCTTENTDRSKDEGDIKANAKAYGEAYNSQDVEKMTSFWATDAVYTDPDTGNAVKGKNAIADYFKDLFTNKENPKIDVVIDKIIFKGPEKAVEYGHVKFTYNDGSQDESAYQAEDVKENGKWLLQTVREVDTGQATSNYEHLKDLNWLIGSWVGSDENMEVDLNFKWDNNNNFLIEHFTVNILDRNEMEGLQIIGWDPSKNTIRSWVFDSDGGIREGAWAKENEKWIATMASTLADGKKATSLDVYTNVDDNTFTFEMISRDIDGEILPDIGSVKFIKKNNP